MQGSQGRSSVSTTLLSLNLYSLFFFSISIYLYIYLFYLFIYLSSSSISSLTLFLSLPTVCSYCQVGEGEDGVRDSGYPALEGGSWTDQTPQVKKGFNAELRQNGSISSGKGFDARGKRQNGSSSSCKGFDAQGKRQNGAKISCQIRIWSSMEDAVRINLLRQRKDLTFKRGVRTDESAWWRIRRSKEEADRIKHISWWKDLMLKWGVWTD